MGNGDGSNLGSAFFSVADASADERQRRLACIVEMVQQGHTLREWALRKIEGDSYGARVVFASLLRRDVNRTLERALDKGWRPAELTADLRRWAGAGAERVLRLALDGALRESESAWPEDVVDLMFVAAFLRHVPKR